MLRSIALLRLACLLLASIFATSKCSLGGEAPDFDREVRPILSDKCYFCHGPDPEHREAELRFDIPEGPLDVIESGEFLRRVNSEDPDERMPPVETKLSLTDSEKQILSNWAAAGAKYEQHWAFVPVAEEILLPKVDNSNWARQPWDRFVLARLDQENLKPSREADPLRWLRRVTLDLTGLPPTLEEMAAFQALLNASPGTACDETVDRLLASPAYGEHMAVAWLDAARYADSYGYQSDKLNTQWPYRDWVVRAFNDNLPYDQFLTWQLAGDLLEHPTSDQRLATAFNRLHRMTNEGGAIFEEWLQENISDRVHTFGTAILGLTLECSRCHDHKYDPITQRDYYSLCAFFNSIDEYGLYDQTERVPPPSLLLPTAEQSAALEAAKRSVHSAEQELQEALQNAADANAVAEKTKVLRVGLLLRLSFNEPFVESDKLRYYPATDNRVSSSDLPREKVSDPVTPPLSGTITERRAVRFDGDRGICLPGIPAVDRWTPFSVVLTLQEPKPEPLREVIAHHSGGTDAGYHGWDLTIQDGYIESRLYRVWPGNGIGVRSKQPIPADQWVQLAATYDGSSKAAGLRLFLNGRELEIEILRDHIWKSANMLADKGGGMVLGQRFRARGFTGGLIDDVRVYDRELSAVELHCLAEDKFASIPNAACIAVLDEQVRAARAKLTVARKAVVLAEEAMQEVPVMEELAKPLPAFLLARGQYDAPKTEECRVTRNTFEQIGPPFPSNAPRNRLGLAGWVTSDANPLASRVIVNRVWASFFGVGLVGTHENFGLQGELPTHPELLDWLARDLMDHGWDLKRLCRQIALSATYRQDSAFTPELVERDPTNRLLARGPSHRLSGEEIRDLALASSGLLSEKRGGPPVSPYQAGGDLWKESNVMSPPYQRGSGEDLYRRSLYSVWKRTAPLPNMSAFDAPSREVCVVKRSRTNTPLQALVLLNDVQFLEAARVLAGELLTEVESDDKRLQEAFERFTGREPTNSETLLLKKLLADEKDYYSSHPAEAEQLLAAGDSPPSEEISPADAAAWTVLCQAILNLDATVWNR